MANPEHLKILKNGVERWNRWREKHLEIVPNLVCANLKRANLSRTYFNYADLSYADLSGADLRDADFSEADLYRADINNALLIGARFVGANLAGAAFRSSDLSSADLSDADLNNASLGNAHLRDAQLSGTNFAGAMLGYTSLVNTDLSQVKGLEAVTHFAPSSIGIDTIYKSQGKIPEVFLRRAGVPTDFITYMRSLTVQPIQFYTCFISFTETDDAFSERLYNDLQMKGVRCWRWKEDAKWGKALMRSIDEAVRVYDKLIVICSSQSLNSPAVIREIERALQKEDDLARQGSEVEILFPIRLDEYIFTEWNHHRKADVIAKNVGDFRDWNEPKQYKKAFDRLLRDLKAEEK